LIEALANASADDLTEIQQRIEQLQKELDSLKQLRTILERRIHGKPPKAAAKTEGNSPLATLVYDAIVDNGPATVEQLALKLDRKVQAIRVAIARKREWFSQLKDGRWAIAVQGGRGGQ